MTLVVDPAEAEFFDGIAAAPDNEQLRRDYAAWLEQRGDPRGAYFRLQCDQLAAEASTDLAEAQRAQQLKERAEEIRSAHPEWASRLFPRLGKMPIGMSRGTVGMVETEVETFLAHAPELLSLGPIYFLRFRKIGPHAEALAGCPYLRWVLGLELRESGLSAQDLACITSSPFLHRLRSLRLAGNAIGRDGVEALVRNAQRLPALSVLSLQSCQIGSAGAELLARSSLMANLEQLDVKWNDLDLGAARALVAGSSRRLSALSLQGQPLGVGFGSVIRDAPQLVGLSSLNLSDCQLDDSDAEAIATAPHLASLKSLSLESDGMTERGARALAESSSLAGLEVLVMSSSIGATAEGLLRSRFGDRMQVRPAERSEPRPSQSEAAPRLQFDPNDWEAFDRRASVLTERKDWPRLARLYRQMLAGRARLRPHVREWEVSRALLALYRDRLNDYASAITVAEVVAERSFQDVQDLHQLAGLYETTDRFDLAEETYEKLLRRTPLDQRAQRRLFEIRLKRSARDAAWCAASALAFCGWLSGSDSDFYVSHKPMRLAACRRSLDRRSWSLLLHADEDERLNEFFTFLAAAAIRAKHEDADTPVELDPRMRPAVLELPIFRSAFAWATQALGIPSSEHVASRGEAQPVAALEAGSELAELHAGSSLQELLFIAGRQAVYHRPWHLLWCRYPTVRSMTLLFFAGLKLADIDHEIPAELSQQVLATMLALRAHITPDALARLGHAARKLRESRISISRYCAALEHSACRAGLLLCHGNLDVAKTILAADPVTEGVPEALPALMADLVGFAPSVAHVALRKELGLGQEEK